MFLKEGIEIQGLQYVFLPVVPGDTIQHLLFRRTIRAKAIEAKEHGSEALTKELRTRRAKLETRLTKWRRSQKSIMPLIGDFVTAQKCVDLESEVLYLPSDFNATQRRDLNLTRLEVHEVKLREGEAYDALRALRLVMKMLSAMRDRKKVQDRGQEANTRSAGQIREGQGRRDIQMANYNAARDALIALCAVQADDPQSDFPRLELRDTYRKSTQAKRSVGDSRVIDGSLFGRFGGTSTANKTGPLQEIPQDDDWDMDDGVEDEEPAPVVGTQMTRKKAKG